MTSKPDKTSAEKSVVSDPKNGAATGDVQRETEVTQTAQHAGSDAAVGPESKPDTERTSTPPKSVADGGTPVEGSTLSEEELDQMTSDIVAALKTVYDPEIPADIYELGLIYRVEIDDDKHVTVDMTLTSPGCPVAGEMPGWVENAVGTVAGASGVKVNLTFDPPWDPSRMSDEARLALNMF